MKVALCRPIWREFKGAALKRAGWFLEAVCYYRTAGPSTAGPAAGMRRPSGVAARLALKTKKTKTKKDLAPTPIKAPPRGQSPLPGRVAQGFFIRDNSVNIRYYHNHF